MKDIKLGEGVRQLIAITFALTFFLCRVLLAPYVYYRLVVGLLYDRDVKCFHPFYVPFVIGFGAIFHTLNFYCKFCQMEEKKRI